MKSSASACSDADPARTPAPISTTNIAALIKRTAHSTRRYFPACSAGTQQSS
jgi:hypothetical protein